MSYTFAPNNLNYVTCNRCFYLMYKHKIKIEGGFPAIFNDLDLKQKDFFIEKVTSVISNDLPEGKFYKTVTQEERKKRKKETKSEFNEMEIPALIKSKELNDKNNRKFVLKGKPDLVVKFENDYVFWILRLHHKKTKQINTNISWKPMHKSSNFLKKVHQNYFQLAIWG